MGKKQKKIVQKQVFTKREDEVDEFSPFKDIVIREASEVENQKRKHNPDNRKGSEKKPQEIIKGYNPNASFADILSSYEMTGNPYRLPKKKAANGKPAPQKDFGDILDMWEGGGRKKTSSENRQKSSYNPSKSFAEIFSEYENVPQDQLVKKHVEPPKKQQMQKKQENAAKPKEDRPREKSEVKVSRSFADILDDFDGVRKPDAEVKAEPADKVEEEKVVLDIPTVTESLFREKEEDEERNPKASWSVFGDNESFVRPEPAKEPEPEPEVEEEPKKEVKRASEPFKPSMDFGEILSSYDRKIEEREPETPAVPEKKVEEVPEDATVTLFREKEEDEERNPKASWSVFGDNESFVRPEPAKEPDPEPEVEEEPKKEVKRASEPFKPSRDFGEILTDYYMPPAPEEVKEDEKLDVKRTSEPGKGRKDSGKILDNCSGRKEGKPEHVKEEAPRKNSKGKSSFDKPYVVPIVEKGDGRNRYQNSRKKPEAPREPMKTFEEILAEKGDGAPKVKEYTVSQLRTMMPQSTLDLHGMKGDEAEKAVLDFLEECRRVNIRKISIITGKGLHSEDGVPVIRNLVSTILDNSPCVSEKTKAPFNYGGTGAFWVILKKKDQK